MNWVNLEENSSIRLFKLSSFMTGNNDLSKRPVWPDFYVAFKSFDKMAVHATALLLILCAIYFAYPFKTLFSWHPLLMIVGFYGFTLQGIVVYNKFSSLVPTANANKKVCIYTYSLNFYLF